MKMKTEYMTCYALCQMFKLKSNFTHIQVNFILTTDTKNLRNSCIKVLRFYTVNFY